MTNIVPILKLNNKGVKLLGMEEYEQAVEAFQKAISEFQTLMSSNMRPTVPSSSAAKTLLDYHQQERLDSSERLETASRKENLSSVQTSQKSSETHRKRRNEEEGDGRRNNCGVTDSSRRKRQRTSTGGVSPRRRVSQVPLSSGSTTETTVKTPLAEPLGRPLWLDPNDMEDNCCERVRNVYASGILYNYAYALHRWGTKLTSSRNGDETNGRNKKSAKLFLHERAMRFYVNAKRLATRVGSPFVLYMSCHNIQQLLLDSFSNSGPTEELAQKHQLLERRKADVLRSMGSLSVAPGNDEDERATLLLMPDRPCLMVLSMLGIGGSEDSPATAA